MASGNIRPMPYGPWPMSRRPWETIALVEVAPVAAAYVLWPMGYGLWSTAYGSWTMTYGL